MAPPRSVARARLGRSLVTSVVVPVAVLGVVVAVVAALLASGGATRAAERQLDARAATVNKAWDAAGRPTSGTKLDDLSARLNANLRVLRGDHPQPAAT